MAKQGKKEMRGALKGRSKTEMTSMAEEDGDSGLVDDVYIQPVEVAEEKVYKGIVMRAFNYAISTPLGAIQCSFSKGAVITDQKLLAEFSLHNMPVQLFEV